MKRITLALMLTLGLGQAHALISGLDDGGYYYKDSDESGFSYDFEDIASDINKVSVSLSDDQSESIPIGFNFNFYDVYYSTLNISSNGFISFTTIDSGCCNGFEIPSAGSYSEIGSGIAAWWEDLNPNSGGAIDYLIKGISPERELIIQFTDVPAYSNSGRNTFQYKLKEADNSIEVHYKELYGDNGLYSIGIQNNATIGLQYDSDLGGSTQNVVPHFTLPHAIKYIKKNIGYSQLSSGIKSILYPGESKLLDVDIINIKSLAVDIQLEGQTNSSDLTIVPVASTYTIGANSKTLISYTASVTPTASGTLNGTIKVSSVSGNFETFEIPIIINISKVEQLSFGSTNNTEKPKISDDGKFLVVLSRDDLAGNGKASSSTDLFLYDIENTNFKQLTNNAPGRQCFNSAISGDGLIAAAVCNGNLDTTKPNLDASNEVYIFNLSENSIFQAGTNLHANSGADDIAINHDGNVILFIANDNLTGENTDGSSEVFSYKLSSQKFTQLSWFDYSSFVTGVDIDYNGKRFVVSSRGNPLDDNNVLSWQVFSGLIDRGVNRQTTNSQGYNSQQAKISANGEYIVFSSTANLLSSSHGKYQIYLTEFDGRNLKKITNSSSNSSTIPDISSDGSNVIFRSGGSFDGANSSSNNEIFIFNTRYESITQLIDVNESRDANYPAIAANGASIVFSGDGDWDTGENPSRSKQLFLISGPEENSVRGFEEKIIKQSSLVTNFDEGDEYKKSDILDAAGYISWLFISMLSLLAFRKRKEIIKV